MKQRYNDKLFYRHKAKDDVKKGQGTHYNIYNRLKKNLKKCQKTALLQKI